MSIITNGDSTMLGFEVQAPANFQRRIATVEELKDRDHPANAEHRIVPNPDQSGGALHQLNRRPILPAPRVLRLPGGTVPSPYLPIANVPRLRPIIGIDFGQKFQAVAVRDNLVSLATATAGNLQANPQQEAHLRQQHRARRRAAITRVRGQQYREMDKSAWFERKEAGRRTQALQHKTMITGYFLTLSQTYIYFGFTVLIDNLRGRSDALWGAGLSEATILPARTWSTGDSSGES
ncbi:hypothetical protein DFS34DRAFT_649163 [Phlyctochytrium arcticum]|nr:hypothetical protein DFS34DRAFT_649163 [Phlyctochytrium arcticum]